MTVSASLGSEGSRTVSAAARPWWELFLPTLILIAPLLSFLLNHGYGLFRPETLLYIAIWVGIGCAAGLLLRRGNSVVRVSILTACVMIFLDIQFDGAQAIGLRRLALLAFGVGILFWFLRTHATRVLMVGFVALTASIVILPDRTPDLRITGVERPSRIATELAPLIILFLDEHAGIEGIPTDLPGGREARARILALYDRYGFSVSDRAYSQYFDTYNAISNVLNGTASRQDNAYFEHRGEPRDLRRNNLFSEASAKGYAIRIYQSDYMNLCDADGVEVESCLTYRRNSIGVIEGLKLPVGQKMRLIDGGYLFGSAVAYHGKAWYNAIAGRLPGLPILGEGARRVGPLPTEEVLDRLELDVLAAPDGRLFLAHLMNPHYPYVYDAACGVKPQVSAWLERNNDRFHDDAPGGNSDRTRQLRYEAYLTQVHCVTDRLEQFFESLETRGILGRAQVIVLGDHGSRITRNDPVTGHLGVLERMDYLDGFATLFAARTPDQATGRTDEPISIARAFARALGRDESTLETDDLLLTGTDGLLTPVPASSLWPVAQEMPESP